MTLGLEFHSCKGDILTIDIRECLARLDAGILQTFQHVNHVRWVYTTRTSTTAQEVVRVLAKQGNSLNLPVLPWQCTVVLQQYYTLVGTLTGDGCMSHKVGTVRGRIFLETWCLDNVLQHATNITIHIGNVEFSTLHALDNLVHLCWLSRLHQVVACLYLGDGGQSFANTNPVGHHDTLKAPVLAQNLGQQVAVPHRVLAVNLVVRRHHSPGVTLAYGNLETTQIQLAGSTLTHALIYCRTVGLLRVDGKVLGTHTGTLTLHTLNISCCNLTCQQRVFRVVLKVSAAQWVAMQVHARSQNHVAAILLGLITNSLSHLVHQVGVPGRSQARADREGCGIIGLVASLTCRVDTYTGRTVGKHSGRNAQTWYGRRCTSSTSHQVGFATYDGIVTEKVVGTANQKFGLFFKGHCLDHLVDILLRENRRCRVIGAELGLSVCCHCKCCC